MKDGRSIGRSCRKIRPSAVLSIGPEVLAGEIANARGQFDSAIAHLDRAVRLEDDLAYTEPAEWQSPPRLALGAILLEAGRPAEAEAVYWEDLRRNRNSGWGFIGLLQALRAQKNERSGGDWLKQRFKRPGRVRTLISTPRALDVFRPGDNVQAQQGQRP